MIRLLIFILGFIIVSFSFNDLNIKLGTLEFDLSEREAKIIISEDVFENYYLYLSTSQIIVIESEESDELYIGKCLRNCILNGDYHLINGYPMVRLEKRDIYIYIYDLPKEYYKHLDFQLELILVNKNIRDDLLTELKDTMSIKDLLQIGYTDFKIRNSFNLNDSITTVDLYSTSIYKRGLKKR